MVSSSKPRHLGAAGLLAFAAAMATRSWRSWGDATIDFPHQLYLAWRTSAGDVMYRDFELAYGPLSQWINGALFSVLGVSYLTVTLANLFLAVAAALAAHAVLGKRFGWAAGALAGLVFLAVHGFGQLEPFSCFNFLGPYAHEATHATLLLLLLTALAVTGRFGAAALCYGLLLLLKPEHILAGGAVLAAAAWLERARWRKFAAAMAWAALPPSLAFAYFVAHGMGAWGALRGAGGAVAPFFFAHLVDSPFYRSAAGLDDLPTHLREIASALLIVATALGLARLFDLRWKDRVPLYLVGLAATAFQPRVLLLARAWPLLCFAGLAWAWRNRARWPADSARTALLLGAAACVLSVKIFFNPTFTMFGFYLLAPGTLFLAALSGRLEGKALRGAAFTLLFSVALQATLLSARFYERKTLRIGEGPDAFYAFDELAPPGPAPARLVAEAVRRVERLTPPGSTVIAIPEGVLVNYLLRRRNPTPMLQTFILQRLLEFSGGTAAVIAELERHPPDYVFYLHRAPEFPGPVFQIRGAGGFAEDVLRWVDERYVPVDRIGPETKDFAELLFELRKRVR